MNGMHDNDILCDSSSLISLTDADLDGVLLFLKKHFYIKFLIPPSVEYEMVERPIKSDLREYLFSAIKIKKNISDGIITKIDADIQAETNNILRIANNTFFVKGKPLRIVHTGEAEMIAMAQKLATKNLLVDERTTRMLIESPIRLKSHLEDEFKVNVMVQKSNLVAFSEIVKDMNIIRSSELVVLSYENKFFDVYNSMRQDALRAALYKLKYSGCSVSFEEINSFMKTVM